MATSIQIYSSGFSSAGILLLSLIHIAALRFSVGAQPHIQTIHIVFQGDRPTSHAMRSFNYNRLSMSSFCDAFRYAGR